MFFFLWNSSRLFSITRSSSFSVIHVSVNIKNDGEKKRRLCFCFFLSKRPGGHVIQIKPWVAFGLPYLLIELFYIGMPVLRTDGRSLDRSLARCTVTWLPNFLWSSPIKWRIKVSCKIRCHPCGLFHWENVQWNPALRRQLETTNNIS